MAAAEGSAAAATSRAVTYTSSEDDSSADSGPDKGNSSPVQLVQHDLLYSNEYKQCSVL